MNISKGRTYRHMSCMDIDMYVMGIRYLGQNHMKLRVCFVNRHNGILYPQDGTVKLKFSDIWKWKLV